MFSLKELLLPLADALDRKVADTLDNLQFQVRRFFLGVIFITAGAVLLDLGALLMMLGVFSQFEQTARLGIPLVWCALFGFGIALVLVKIGCDLSGITVLKILGRSSKSGGHGARYN